MPVSVLDLLPLMPFSEHEPNGTHTRRANVAAREGGMNGCAGPPARFLTLRGLIAAGVLALAGDAWWWHTAFAPAPLWLTVPLALAFLYLIVQVAGSWALYAAATRPPAAPGPADGLTVDVFVTACGEPHDMIARTLAAALAMRGPHRTWLLDDGDGPALEALARRLGAGYLTRADHRDAKAGNLNAALARTEGELIAVFDIDHVPAPDFLEASVGHFADPAVGFVQVMLTFANQSQSWIARAASESCLDFYNPTSVGMERLGSTTLMGSNSLLRRAALDSIGGYRPGLAEDLATSISLHAAGWRSAYVAAPLAPGLAPSDLVAWFTQQMKWARGVFELLLTAYPRLWPRLTAGQRLGYTVRMTKYWIGPFVGTHLVLTLLVLLFGGPAAQRFFQEYLLALLPVVLLDALIRHVAIRLWRPPGDSSISIRRAAALVYATFPIYTLAWLMALLRLPLAFRPTPKSAEGGLKPVWRLPLIAALLMLGGAAARAACAWARPPLLVLGFAALQSLPILVLLWQSFLRDKRKRGAS